MKIVKMLGLVAIAAMFSLSLTSCGGYSASAAEKMHEKYDDGEMEKEDYEQCLQWMEDLVTDWETLTEEGIKDVKNEKQWENKKEEIEEQLSEDWEGIDDIDELLTEACYNEDKEMGSANQKRFEKLYERVLKKSEKFSEQLAKKLDVEPYSVELPEPY